MILERGFVGRIVNITNDCPFSWVLCGMNRSAEQANLRFVYTVTLPFSFKILDIQIETSTKMYIIQLAQDSNRRDVKRRNGRK